MTTALAGAVVVWAGAVVDAGVEASCLAQETAEPITSDATIKTMRNINTFFTVFSPFLMLVVRQTYKVLHIFITFLSRFLFKGCIYFSLPANYIAATPHCQEIAQAQKGCRSASAKEVPQG
jgi:hypothetical protein